jgi:DNA-binding MarR family transcriptional regulator
MTIRAALKILWAGLIVVAVATGIIALISLVVAWFVSPNSATYVVWVGVIFVGVIACLSGLSQITGVNLRDVFGLSQKQTAEVPKEELSGKKLIANTVPGVVATQEGLSQEDTAVLLEIHKRGKGNTATGAVAVEQIARDLSLEQSEVRAICRYLEDANLIRHFEDTGRLFVITHRGEEKSRLLLGSAGIQDK